MNFFEARSYCRSINGRLAEVPDYNTQTFLACNLPSSETNWWLGGTDRSKEGQWIWDGSGLPLYYTGYFNWKQGEPNDYSEDEDCMMMYGTKPGMGIWAKWNDLKCTAKKNGFDNWGLHAICEKDMSTNSLKIPLDRLPLDPEHILN